MINSDCKIVRMVMIVIRVAEVVRGHGGPPPKSLDSDEKDSHYYMFIICIK